MKDRTNTILGAAWVIALGGLFLATIATVRADSINVPPDNLEVNAYCSNGPAYHSCQASDHCFPIFQTKVYTEQTCKVEVSYSDCVRQLSGGALTMGGESCDPALSDHKYVSWSQVIKKDPKNPDEALTRMELIQSELQLRIFDAKDNQVNVNLDRDASNPENLVTISAPGNASGANRKLAVDPGNAEAEAEDHLLLRQAK